MMNRGDHERDPITGGCLCGGVRYAVARVSDAIQVCHCRRCQKAQGAACVPVLPVAAADFEWRAGESLIVDYESSPGKHRLFCGRCGSPLISRRDDRPEAVRLRAATLDADPGVRPVSRAFVAEASDWLTPGDDVVAHAGPRPSSGR